MKQLKCESCGGLLKVDEEKEFAICPYCNAKYKLNEDKIIHIKFDDNFNKSVKTSASIISIVFVIIFVVFAVLMGSVITRSINFDKEDTVLGNNADYFNNSIELFSGTQSRFFLRSLIDEIVISNKKNEDRLISVIYKDFSTTDTEELIKIKDSLEDKNYEVEIEYDEDGYIYKVRINEK